MKTGIELIKDERERQVSQEGWTAGSDDKHQPEYRGIQRQPGHPQPFTLLP